MASRLNCSRLHAIVAKQGSPCFAFDLDKIEELGVELLAIHQACLGGGLPFYSFKTNSERQIASVFRDLGYGAEVVSGRELLMALEYGFPTTRIIFNGPYKHCEELRLALEKDVIVHVDSLDEMRTIANIRPEKYARIGLRIATSVGPDKQRLSRFGLSLAELKVAVDMARANNLLIRGVHLHGGSNFESVEAFSSPLREATTAVQFLVASNATALEWIDIGGGFPGPSAATRPSPQTFRKYLTAAKAALTAWPVSTKGIPILTEPGRILVEGAGYLLTRLVAIKSREPVNILVLDAGRNLVPSAGSNRHHPLYWLRTGALSQRFSIYGRNCFENDLLDEWARGPERPRLGDLLAIGNVGAYDWSTSFSWTDPPASTAFMRRNDVIQPSIGSYV